MAQIYKLLFIGLVIRLLVVAYGEWHDQFAEVPFTDVDYKVFTDAARHMYDGESPYMRHTYRYPPLIAFLLTPNIWLHGTWGKVFFSLADIATAFIIYFILKAQGQSEPICIKCSCVWIFNPHAVIIAARGNSDSIIALIVLLTVSYLQKKRVCLAGMLMGLAIHIRLYPAAFSLATYLSLRDIRPTTRQITSTKSSLIKTFFKNIIGGCKYLYNFMYPNKEQFYFALSTVLNLLSFTGIGYLLYGKEYLDESILYHLKRKDTRHNFSVYFYLQYLHPNQPSWLMFLPQLTLLFLFSFMYGNKRDLNFCLLLQSIIIVTYNPVMTSQYFIWFLSLLPPVLPYLSLSFKQSTALTSLWVAAQLAWLLPAYWLEFRGRNTFLYIWLQGVAFFCANLAVLVRLIKAYKFTPAIEAQSLRQKVD